MKGRYFQANITDEAWIKADQETGGKVAESSNCKDLATRGSPVSSSEDRFCQVKVCGRSEGLLRWQKPPHSCSMGPIRRSCV